MNQKLKEIIEGGMTIEAKMSVDTSSFEQFKQRVSTAMRTSPQISFDLEIDSVFRDVTIEREDSEKFQVRVNGEFIGRCSNFATLMELLDEILFKELKWG